MIWNLSVPKTLLIYWGADKLSYMRYLTVKSFIHFNPDWMVILWLPKFPSVRRTWESNQLEYEVECADFLDMLKELVPYQMTVDFKQYGLDNTISEVHKSDYLRLDLLASWGGVWSDMDIIYFKPMTSLAVNTPKNKDKDTFVCINKQYGHSCGFLMSVHHNSFYRKMVDMAKIEFDGK